MRTPIALLAQDHRDEVDRWLSSQTNIVSWSADFVQTRTLKALRSPLQSRGHLWFQSPNRFRWELGSPPKTIALRQPNSLLVLYPALNRGERYPLDHESTAPWQAALALLEAGFPRSREELDSKFRVLSVVVGDSRTALSLEPRSPVTRRFMPRIDLIFDRKSFALTASELHFADGSRLRNDFSNITLNPELDPELFQLTDAQEEFEWVEPGSGRR